jgi:hypothetical protein
MADRLFNILFTINYLTKEYITKSIFGLLQVYIRYMLKDELDGISPSSCMLFCFLYFNDHHVYLMLKKTEVYVERLRVEIMNTLEYYYYY